MHELYPDRQFSTMGWPATAGTHEVMSEWTLGDPIKQNNIRSSTSLQAAILFNLWVLPETPVMFGICCNAA